MAASAHACQYCFKHTLMRVAYHIKRDDTINVLRCGNPSCFGSTRYVIFCHGCRTTVDFRSYNVCLTCLKYNHGCRYRIEPTVACIICKQDTCFIHCKDATPYGYPGRRICNHCVFSSQVKLQCHAITLSGKRCQKLRKESNIYCPRHKHYKGARIT